MAPHPIDRIAFMDIDGVLLPFPTHYMHTWGEEGPTMPQSVLDAMRLLVDAQYRFVLHSSWRHSELGRAYDLFYRHNLHLSDHVSPDIADKGKAIRTWLDEQYGGGEWPDRMLVFDDDNLSVPTRLVDPNIGLTVSQVKSQI